MSEEKDKNLINFIATTVEAMRDRMDTMNDRMATKEDLTAIKKQMATKDGLVRLETTMKGEFEQVHIRIDSIVE